eukprot:TRINITY_DN12802_c0_g1_i1.p2 TRINITY_DN12802_c0_g1~~TRINITY_DN12802_c0_g1_i1.p2  ORF type:complete len:366 (+),score=116.64 TRINITY_DN12802_c0_g1_i1:52-1149(+)
MDAQEGREEERPTAEFPLQHTEKYRAHTAIASGGFAVVYMAADAESGDTVAIKQVAELRSCKNRELIMMQQLAHPNVVALKEHYYSNGPRRDGLYLNLVMEYMPESLHSFGVYFTKYHQYMPLTYVRLFGYQMLRGLHYLHFVREVCHRDVKPRNILVDPTSGVAKLCDFGSAKKLEKGEPSLSYVCSRHYRAPELVLGVSDYGFSVDSWSAGCVLAEMLIGQPLFPGESNVDQMVEIVKVLGAPSREEVDGMMRSFTDFRFPMLRPCGIERALRGHTPPEGVRLVQSLLRFHPSQRMLCIQGCAHPFFEELSDAETTTPVGTPLPSLFSFTAEEVEAMPAAVAEKLVRGPADDVEEGEEPQREE